MKFGAVPVAVPVQSTLDGCAPKLRAAVLRVLAAVPDAIVFESLRSDARQSYLWGFGRLYDDGRGLVTHSETALDTWHHFGLAVDIIHRVSGWDAPPSFWSALGDAAHDEQLVWGGDWSMRDLPHVQWGAPMRRSPSPSAAALLASGGLPAVWAAVGAA